MSQYGCYNRPPFRPAFVAQDGWYVPGHKHKPNKSPEFTSVPFRMSEDCNYTLTSLGRVDAHCAGCKHKKEE